MKKNLLLFALPLLLAACGKNNVRPVQDISGDYSTNVHYLHTWMQSQNNYGTVLDTNYTTPFHVEYSSDTITVSYMSVNGAGITEKLIYQSTLSLSDTLRFSGLWNGYSYTTSNLTFYKDINQFKYTRNQHTNPSGGGNDINYTINSQ